MRWSVNTDPLVELHVKPSLVKNTGIKPDSFTTTAKTSQRKN